MKFTLLHVYISHENNLIGVARKHEWDNKEMEFFVLGIVEILNTGQAQPQNNKILDHSDCSTHRLKHFPLSRGILISLRCRLLWWALSIQVGAEEENLFKCEIDLLRTRNLFTCKFTRIVLWSENFYEILKVFIF